MSHLRVNKNIIARIFIYIFYVILSSLFKMSQKVPMYVGYVVYGTSRAEYQGFLRGAGKVAAASVYHFAKFRRKLHENEDNWTECGGRCPKLYCVDPPLLQLFCFEAVKFICNCTSVETPSSLVTNMSSFSNTINSV